MTPAAPLRMTLVAGLWASWATGAGALPSGCPSDPVGPTAAPVVLFGHDGRQTLESFAAQTHTDVAALRHQFSASGLLQCGAAHGAAQLTVTNNVITTAAHVFFGPDGGLRAKSCTFKTENDGAALSVAVDLSSIEAGSRAPYSVEAVHDWAVARLATPVRDAVPYKLASAATPGTAIVFAARGHWDWGNGYDLSVEACHLHDQLHVGAEGTREFAFDCDTGDGSSGGALLAGSRHDALSAVLVGYRSVDPEASRAFSDLHYNFAVTVEGAFRDAVIAATQPLVVTR